MIPLLFIFLPKPTADGTSRILARITRLDRRVSQLVVLQRPPPPGAKVYNDSATPVSAREPWASTPLSPRNKGSS
jgi:hypothetical protein